MLESGSDFQTVSDWLRAPYWRSAASERARLDAWLRDHASIELDVGALRSLLARAPHALESAAREMSEGLQRGLRELGESAATPRQWSQRAYAALEALGWPGSRVLGSEEQQSVNRLLELLKELGGLGIVAQRWSRAEALGALRELCARTSFSPASGDVPVTLSPMLAAPVTHYDGIWVAGLTADTWPQAVATDPFLPVLLQRDLAMPGATAAHRLREAQLLMHAWRGSSGELTLSAPRRQGDIELATSPLLAALQCAPAPRLGGGPLAQILRRAGAVESLIDIAGVAFAPDSHLPGGTYALQLQNDCPFHAYAQFRLGCEERRPPAPGVELDIRGRLLHGALQELWSRLRTSQALKSLDEAACRVLIDQSIEAAARQLWGSGPATPPQQRERLRDARLILALCDLERGRPGFTVQDIEREELLRIAGMTLSMRIDRIDALEAGGLAILDYKSGRAGKAEWYESRPSHVQLMAYLAGTAGDVRALATINITARETRFSGLAATATLLPKVRAVEGIVEGDIWQARIRQWLACIERLVSEFAAGYAAVDPKPLACRYCPIDSLCRIAENPLPIDDALLELIALDE